MPSYTAPLRDVRFLLFELLDAEQEWAGLPGLEVDRATVDQMLETASRFATDVLFPLNQSGDRAGCTLKDGEVTTPRGFREAFQQVREAGWGGLDCAPEDGGMGLPHSLSLVLGDILGS